MFIPKRNETYTATETPLHKFSQLRAGFFFLVFCEPRPEAPHHGGLEDTQLLFLFYFALLLLAINFYYTFDYGFCSDSKGLLYKLYIIFISLVGKTRCIILSYWARNWVTPLDAQICPADRLRRSRRLAGRKRILYILMGDLTWRGGGRIWAIVEMVEPARKYGLHGMETQGRAASLRSQDSLPWTAETPGYFSTRNAIKRHSRDTFFPFQCLRETSSSMALVSPAVPLYCPKWRLAMRQKRR